MSDNSQFESRLWELLARAKLAELSQFHQPGLVDEIPFYSRESDLHFLPKDKTAASTILLGFALKFLNAVIAYERHRTPYIAAITVWSFADVHLVPNLFVACDAVRELEAKLTLKAVATPFGKRIKKLVATLGLGDSLEILEETATLSDATRIFVAPALPPYPGFVTLDHFRKSARPAKKPRPSAPSGTRRS